MPTPLKREVSVTIIRKNVEKTELMLRTFQHSISPKKISKIGNLGAKISFDENDTDTASKVMNNLSGLNVNDEEDKIILVTRTNGIVESSVACDRVQLEKFLLTV